MQLNYEECRHLSSNAESDASICYFESRNVIIINTTLLSRTVYYRCKYASIFAIPLQRTNYCNHIFKDEYILCSSEVHRLWEREGQCCLKLHSSRLCRPRSSRVGVWLAKLTGPAGPTGPAGLAGPAGPPYQQDQLDQQG